MSVSPEKRLLSPEQRSDDGEQSFRPLSLIDFTGQEAARANLKIFIEAAKRVATPWIMFFWLVRPG